MAAGPVQTRKGKKGAAAPRARRGAADAVAAPPARRPRSHAAAPQRLRIIGGRWRRTLLPVADAPGLRPTPDRVRETLFNWIAHLRPDLAALRGLDLFAGTGALGLELASRGAARVTLVERAPALVAQLRALRERLAAAEVEVIGGDALAVARRLPAASVDLLFLDPPFDAGLYAPALAAAAPLLAPGALVYIESAQPPSAAAAAQGLRLLREMKAGIVHAQLWVHALPAPSQSAGAAAGVARPPHLPLPADH